MAQLSNAAFAFSHRNRNWNFSQDAFEGVRIQEYCMQEFRGEDIVNLYKGDRDNFSSFEHFIASVSVLQFEDNFPLAQHREELAKIELHTRSHDRFTREWNGCRPIERTMPPCPDLVGVVYQSRDEWN